ncbi:MAG: hypothetical protein EPN23_07025 [Verrucomicrobia bacterium]|nr:MAG: hypothetical protein EPN23_07025 [Verrucomicrobiota bacterium]
MTGCGRGRLDAGEQPGEMVMYSETSRIRSMDPALTTDVSSALAVAKIYETLLQYAYLDRPYHVEPLLAAAMPEVSADGLTYTFKLRHEIYFQDDPCFRATGGKGRELVATDFIYGLLRVMDIKVASAGAWAFAQIVGMEEWRATTGGEQPTRYDQPIAGLQAPDRYTLRIRLKQPQPQLLWILTMAYAAPVAREAVAFYGKEFVNHPIGTGPFILKSYRPNYRYEFARNPKWRATGRVDRYPTSTDPRDPPELRAAAGQPVPFLDRIVQYVVDDSTTAWLMFLTGQLEYSPIARDNWDAVFNQSRELNADLVRKGIRLTAAPTMQIYYVGFNFDDPVVGKNKKLRQAMSCAFNEAEYNKFFNNRITRPTGPLPPGVAGYVEQPQPYPFDLARAKKLLAEAGYPEGIDPQTGRRLQLQLEAGSADSSEARQAMELFCSFMDKIGIVVKPNFNNWPTFLEKLERRQVQIYSLAWMADYPDAENFLQLFYGPNSSPSPNHCNYVNPIFDHLYEQARVMQDSPARTALYQQMSAIIIEDCPWLMIALPLDHLMHHGWLGNYKYHDFPYGMIKYYTINADARRAWKQQHARP